MQDTGDLEDSKRRAAGGGGEKTQRKREEANKNLWMDLGRKTENFLFFSGLGRKFQKHVMDLCWYFDWFVTRKEFFCWLQGACFCSCKKV